jgi:predicted transcriptional regulator
MLKMAREETRVMGRKIIQLRMRGLSAGEIAFRIHLSYRAVCLYLQLKDNAKRSEELDSRNKKIRGMWK